MAAEQMCGQLLDCGLSMAFKEQLSTDEITRQRQEVIWNVAGHWAVEGVTLPGNLDVPGVLSYESIGELLREPPKTVCKDIYTSYTDLQEKALATALGGTDSGSDIDRSPSDVAHGVLLESANRIGKYRDILQALDKPTELLTDIFEDPAVLTVHHPQTVANIIHDKAGSASHNPGQQLTRLILASTDVTRMQINVERDVAMDAIAGQPVSGAMLDLLKTDKARWRQRVQGFFRKR